MLDPRARGFTVLLGALAMAPSFSVDMSLPALPTLTTVFATTPDQVQLTIGLFVIGYAGGQLAYGPLSDRFGRRPVLLGGLLAYTLCSLACLAAPTIGLLIAFRLAQGCGACVGVVLGRAAVRDHFSGGPAAQMLSSITAVMALAPLVAPLIGGQLLAHFGWSSIFACHAAFGILLLIATWLGFGESLTHLDHHGIHPARILGNYRRFFTNRQCFGFAMVNAFTFAGLFAFISGSPFVLIDIYHVSTEHYGLYFGSSAFGFMLGAFFGRRLLQRYSGTRLLAVGLILLVAAAVALFLLGFLRWGGAIGITLPFVLYTFAMALVLPNATQAAMEPLPQMAGTAASLMGATQFATGSIAGYLVTRFYDGTPNSMGLAMALMALSAFAVYRLLLRQGAVAA